MIVGHFGLVGLVRSRLRLASLVWLIPAAVAPDLLDLMYSLTGICSPYGLYSHTLPAVVLLAAAIGGAALLAEGRATALGCALVALLHPALDFFTGNKLFWPGGEMHGLRLYDRPLSDFALESIILVAGWSLARRAGDRPMWTRSIAGLAALLAIQATANVLHRSIKPSTCAMVPAARL